MDLQFLLGPLILIPPPLFLPESLFSIKSGDKNSGPFAPFFFAFLNASTAKPINAFLIAVVSYIIYRLGSNYTPLKYLTKRNLYSLLLITISFSLMMVLNDFEANNMISDIAFRGGLVLLLSILPLVSIYKTFKENNFKF